MTPAAAAISLGVVPLAVGPTAVPRLLRATERRMVPAASATAMARAHVERLAPVWGVAPGAAPVIEGLGEVAVPGGAIVRLRQVIDGLPVEGPDGGELRVLVGQDGALMAASGVLVAADTPRSGDPALLGDDAGAVARAVTAKYGATFASQALASRAPRSGARTLAGRSGAVEVSAARARRAWYASGHALTPAWIVEAYTSDATTPGGDATRTVLAADGRVVASTDLRADAAYQYRVFAETTGEHHPSDGPMADPSPHATGVPGTVPFPPYVPPSLVTVDGLNHPVGATAPDPWLPPGSTETVGNNVDAYADLNAPDGLTAGDFRAAVTTASSGDAPGAFDRTYDPSLSALASSDQQMAAITSLFFTINWLHDFWYDAGFTEAAGNAQLSNFGRGGEEGDPLHAEAEDSALTGQRDNANMVTPSDGLSPRMQVMVWDGVQERTLSVSGRSPVNGPPGFGPASFDVTASVVLANDGVGTTSDACQPLVGSMTGKIVLVDRGICSVKAKALAVQNAGGAAMILADNATDSVPPDLPDDPRVTTPIAIGSLSVLKSEGTAIKADLLAGPVTATLHRKVAPLLDGALDATVVSHEFGHYVHHRLSSCTTTLCAAMSEGWADFDALLVMAREHDDLAGAFPIGVYSSQSLPGDTVYFGIRRAPYSVTPSINALAFHHMADDQELPTTTPLSGGGPNSEVHNAGEVWASMLWEGYVALQRAGHSFDAVRRTMQQYVVNGLLLAPPDATPTETRDALLIAAHAVSPADHDVLAAAYARRGFGTCAESPPRDSQDFVGIVDSTEVKGLIAPGQVTMQLTASCDGDDLLDAGETAQISVAVANPGAAALSDLVVSLSSSTPGVQVLNPTARVAELAAYDSATATFDVRLDDSVTTAVVGEFVAQIAAGNACESSATVPFTMLLNASDLPASSATDEFDARGSVWSPSGDGADWTHLHPAVIDGLWAGGDPATTDDAGLESPVLHAGSGAVSVTIRHRFSFEFDASRAAAFDGGVIEFSTDDGTSWQDVSSIPGVTPGYNQPQIFAPASTNPLAGRPAYGATSPGYPAFSTVTLDFGTWFRDAPFRLRFRIGSDVSVGAPGWEIDSVAFTGLAETPFPTLIADSACNPESDGGAPPGGMGSDGGMSPDAGMPSDPVTGPELARGGCQTTTGGSTTAVLLLGGAILALRRRARSIRPRPRPAGRPARAPV